MDIKNEEELANILAMGFRTFSTEIGRGIGLDSFKPLIEGKREFAVQFALDGLGRISFASASVKPVQQSTETADLSALPRVIVETVKKAAKENLSL